QTRLGHLRPIVARFVQGAAWQSDVGDVPESGQIMWVKRLARGSPGVASLRSSLTVLSERDRRRQRYYDENPHTHQAISHFRTPSHTPVRTIAGPLRSSRFRHRIGVLYTRQTVIASVCLDAVMSHH